MKKFFAITAVIFLICAEAYSFSLKSGNLYPINDNAGGGYINKHGDIVIEQQYNFAFNFVGNYAIVQGKNMKYGVINKKGNAVINFEYDNLDNLNENFVTYKENDKYGYIDIIKNKKLKAEYDSAKKFKEGLAAVCIDNKCGFINTRGEYIIKPQYYNTGNFSEGLAAVSNSEYETSGYINKKGTVVISFKDNFLEPKEFHHGLAPIIKGNDKACSYINKRGKIVIDNTKMRPINVYCGDFHEGLNIFYIDDNPHEIVTGFIDKKGRIKYDMTFSIPEIVSEGEFSAFDEFNSNMARITIDYRTGYINNKFQLIIPPIYEFARDFIGDLAYVKFEDKEGYINKKGQWVWSKVRQGM
ncbi:WG repeat-containing protein [bacterium]|nr:WG repeat-containing protein [bacterium]